MVSAIVGILRPIVKDPGKAQGTEVIAAEYSEAA